MGTYFSLKENKEIAFKRPFGGKKQIVFCVWKNLMLFSLISMNNTSFKLFYLLSVLWKTRPRKEIQASRQNIILIAQTWLKAEKDFKSRENQKKNPKKTKAKEKNVLPSLGNE